MKAPVEKSSRGLSVLRQFVRQPETFERCQLCHAPVRDNHRHLLEINVRKIICTCDPCALRFQNVTGGRFQLIPHQVRPLPGFQITEEQWAELALPIDLAFIFHNTASGKIVAVYPSPAGPVESLLPITGWELMRTENPALDDLKPDVEAVLINRVGAAREYFIAPIDVCYELVGLIRKSWRGFAGGPTVWQEIERLFTRLGRPIAPRAAA